MLPATLQFLIVMIAIAIKDRLQRNLDYTREEVSVLKEQVAAAAAVSGLPPAGPAERKREPLALAVHGGVRSHPGGAWGDFMAHYHAERFHQGLGGQLIQKPAGSAKENGVHGKVVCRSRLGGMLSFYVREAA